jgi:hypothetical protein
MLLMYAEPAQTQVMSAADRNAVGRKHAALRAELSKSGELVGGDGLAYPADTTTVRLEAGSVVTSPGPLLSSSIQLTAHYLVDCGGPDRARAIAVSILDSHVTAIEVRPVHDSVDLGA